LHITSSQQCSKSINTEHEKRDYWLFRFGGKVKRGKNRKMKKKFNRYSSEDTENWASHPVPMERAPRAGGNRQISLLKMKLCSFWKPSKNPFSFFSGGTSRKTVYHGQGRAIFHKQKAQWPAPLNSLSNGKWPVVLGPREGSHLIVVRLSKSCQKMISLWFIHWNYKLL
jgi:hypothetical protein